MKLFQKAYVLIPLGYINTQAINIDLNIKKQFSLIKYPSSVLDIFLSKSYNNYKQFVIMQNF